MAYDFLQFVIGFLGSFTLLSIICAIVRGRA
jgi:hypothetical protein